MTSQVQLLNLSRPQAPVIQAAWCERFLCQLRGLMLRADLPAQHGLLLVQARDSRTEAAIHMLFMRMDLGVVWINAEQEVVDTCLARRWRMAYVPRRPARYVLEARPEVLDYFQSGDRIRFEPLV